MPTTSRASGELSQRSFERILLIKPSSLGDVIHALPVLCGLRRRYPEARIDWLIGTAFAELLAGHKDLDELVMFDRRRFGRLASNPRIAAEFFRFVRGLRRRHYDLVVDLQGLFRTGFLAWATAAGVRIGFHDAREGAAVFYTHRLHVEDKDSHAVDKNCKVGEMLGFASDPVEFNLPISDVARSDVRSLLSERSVGDGTTLVAVVPGARWETKVWPVDRFSRAIDDLHADGPVRCILLGGRDEVALCREIVECCESKPIDLSGQTDLPRLAAAVELADVVLCHDSGVMHIAVALDRPLVCLVGPTNPARTGPYRRLRDVVRIDLDCAPCYLRRLPQCPHEHRCMKGLSVEVVVEAVKSAVNRRR